MCLLLARRDAVRVCLSVCLGNNSHFYISSCKYRLVRLGLQNVWLYFLLGDRRERNSTHGLDMMIYFKNKQINIYATTLTCTLLLLWKTLEGI